jgi:hypothetical protein
LVALLKFPRHRNVIRVRQLVIHRT